MVNTTICLQAKCPLVQSTALYMSRGIFFSVCAAHFFPGIKQKTENGVNTLCTSCSTQPTWLQPEGYFTGPPPPPNAASTQPLSMMTAASSPVTLWSVMLRRVARLTPGGKRKKGFIHLCCSERRLRVVGKAWGWWCRLFSSQWVRRHLCALHRKHHNLVWWKSERAIWDSTGSGWWLCVCVWVCQVETWHCEWNPILYRATSVAPHE